MIEKLVTSKTRIKILNLFLSHIDDRYYLRELERMLDESLSPLRRQLVKLVNMGILIVEEEANLQCLIAKVKEFKRELADEEDRIRVEKFIGYLTNNLDGMKPSNVPQEVKRRFPDMYRRGSGTIESNVFWAICQRFKAPRMSWSAHGLENLRFLRELYLNEGFIKRPHNNPAPSPLPEEPRHIQELREVLRDW